jgi:hypothetical protein
LLGSITMGSSGTLSLDNGTTSYDMSVDAGSGPRRIEFTDLANADLSSFTIVNSLGVTLASRDNSVAIIPQ